MSTTDVLKRTFALNSVIDRSMFQKTTRSIASRGPLAWLVEIVENANDAGATQIALRVEKDSITITDNGRGFTPAGCSAYVSLFHSEGPNTRKGKFGIGAKVAADVAQRASVTTLWEGKPDEVIHFSFTYKELERALFEDGYSIKAMAEPRTNESFPRQLSTGSVVVFSEFKTKPPSVNTIVQKLGKFVSPWLAEKIRVNGDPLEQREIRGERIERDEDDAILGRVRVRLYVPLNQVPDEELEIGSEGPVMRFRDFLRKLDSVSLERVPEAFLQPNLCGLIDVGAFNAFATQQRESFENNLYESDILNHFLTYLDLHLAEELERKVGLVRQAEDAQRNARLLDIVQERINRVYHHVPGSVAGNADGSPPPNPDDDIDPVISSIELSPGDIQVFRVNRLFQGNATSIVWDASKSGGKLDTDQGTQVIYTAGKTEGRFVLTVRDKHRAASKREIIISIVVAREFHTSPRRLTIARMSTAHIYARNTQVTSGNLRWKASGSGGTLNNSQGTTVHYTSGMETGVFTLRVEDRKNPGIGYDLPINIVDEKKKRTTKNPGPGEFRAAAPHEIKVGDRVFSIKEQALVQRDITSQATPGKEITLLFLNMKHPMFVAAREVGDEMAAQAMMHEIASVYAVLEYPDNAVEMSRTRAEVLATMFASSLS